MKPKVTFLFGAGAEECFGLPVGKRFLEGVIPRRTKGKPEVIEPLRKMYNTKIGTYNREWLGRNGYCANMVYAEDLKEGGDGTLKTYGHMEAYFHTIICPEIYGEINFWKVVNHYWLAFFEVFNPLYWALKNPGLENYSKTFASREGETCKDRDYYIKVLNDLPELIKRLYDADWNHIFKRVSSYYDSHFFGDDNEYEVRGIITTNYTPLVNMTGVNPEEVAFINGEMKLFEYPYELVIKDVTRCEEALSYGIFFPFIFTQSAVKPIVAPCQVLAMCKAVKLLRGSDILVMIGYGINDNDNHINAAIIDFIRQPGNQLILYCDRKKNKLNKNSKLNELSHKLRLDRSMSNFNIIEHGCSMEEIVRQIKENIKS